MRKIILLKFVILIAMAGLLTLPTFAQTEKTIDVDKDGEFHISAPMKVGDRTITNGMYRMYHVFENTEHFIVIRQVGMGNYWKTMGPLQLGNEVARLRTIVEAVNKQNRNTKIAVRRNAADERFAFAVWFRGEKTKHILPTR